MTFTEASWFQDKLQKICNEIDVLANLSQLKVALTALNSVQLAQLAPNIQVEVIFDGLNSSDREQINMCCEILRVILPALPVQMVLTQFKAQVNRALMHPEKNVKEVILQELIHCISDPALINDLRNDSNSLKNVIGSLCDDELSVGNLAIKFLIALGKIPEGLTIICHPAMKQALIEAVGTSDICKMRLYQVVIDISVDSYEALKKIEKEGFVEGLYNQLSSDDVLSRLSLLEEITKLALTTHGFEFLQKQKLLDLMVKQLEMCQKDSLSSLICPGTFKFFGSLGQKYPSELFSAYPSILITLIEATQSDDLPVSVSAMEAVGFIATSSVGKLMLKSQDKKKMPEVLNRMESSMRTLASEWRIRTVNSVANLIHLEDFTSSREVTQVSQEWFELLGTDALPNIYKMALQPFPDLKSAAMQVMVELARHSWGQRKIKSCPGLLDFLLERTTENTLEGMQAKYNIIFNIVESPYGSECFEESDFWRLKEYIKQGPCFAPTLTEVAFEGQN